MEKRERNAMRTRFFLKWILAAGLILVSPGARAQVDTGSEDTTEVEISPGVDIISSETASDFEEKTSWTDSTVPITRHLPDSVLSKMKKDEDFWYADAKFNQPEKVKEQEDYVPFTQRTWFKVLFWLVIIGGFVAFIIWWLSGNSIGMFRKKTRSQISSQEAEEIPEDIFAINYSREIDKAAQAGNYRLAVRLMFLQLLKSMSERNIISYKQDRTNFDYLLQLNATRFYNDFFRITRNYEYSWYGKFDISSDAYSVIKTDFSNLTNQL
jgi:hypothetical protein